jgi:hypothetical protein
MRGFHSPGSGRITAPGSSWPQSTSHRAAEALPDFERGLDDGVARELRRDRFEFICTRVPLAIVHSSREERGGMVRDNRCSRKKRDAYSIHGTGKPSSLRTERCQEE